MLPLSSLPNKGDFSVPEYKTEHFDQINGGVDLVNDPMQLMPLQALDTSNIMFTQGGWRKRPGLVKLLSTDSFSAGASIIKSIGILNSRMYKVVAVGGVTKLQWADSGGSWADTTSGTLTDSTRNFDFVNGKGLSGTATITGLITSSATIRTIVPTTTMTVNSYVGSFVKITSGLGINQVIMITSNTATTIFLEDIFDIIPLSTDTFSIFTSETVTYVGNVLNNVKKIIFGVITSTAINIGTSFQFVSIEYHKNRLFGVLSGRLYFSNLGQGDYFGPNSYIELLTGSNYPTIKSFGDRLVIFTDMGRYDLYGSSLADFTLQKRSDKSAGFATLQGFQNISNSSSSQHFISFQGLESLNMVEYSGATDSIPISSNIMTLNTFGKYSQIGAYNNRVYIFSSGTQYGTTPTRFYIYDIKQSLINQYPTWSIGDLPKTVTAIYWDNTTTRLYIAYDGVIAYFDENLYYDWDSNFTSSVTTPRRVQKDPRRKKKYIKCEDKFYVTLNGTIQIYASIFGGAYNLVNTKTYTGTTTPQEIQINTFLRGIDRDISFKYVCTPSGTGGAFDNISHDLFYTYLPKTL